MAKNVNVNSLELGTDLSVTSTDITSIFFDDVSGIVNANAVTFSEARVDGELSSFDAVGFNYSAREGDVGTFTVFTDGASAFAGLQFGEAVDVSLMFTVNNNGVEEAGELTFSVVGGANDYDVNVTFGTFVQSDNTLGLARADGDVDDGELAVSVIGDLTFEELFDAVDLTDDAPLDSLEEFVEQGAGFAAAFAYGEFASASAATRQFGSALAEAFDGGVADARGIAGVATAFASGDGSEGAAFGIDGAEAVARGFGNNGDAVSQAVGEGGFASASAGDGADAVASTVRGSAVSFSVDFSSAEAASVDGRAVSEAFGDSEALAVAAQEGAVATATAGADGEDNDGVVSSDGSSAVAIAVDNALADATATEGSSALGAAIDGSRAVASAEGGSASVAFAEDASVSVASGADASSALANSSAGGVVAADASLSASAQADALGAGANIQANDGSVAQAITRGETIGVSAQDGAIASVQFAENVTVTPPTSIAGAQQFVEGAVLNGEIIADNYALNIFRATAFGSTTEPADLEAIIGAQLGLVGGDSTALAEDALSIDTVDQAQALFNTFDGDPSALAVSADESDFSDNDAPLGYDVFFQTGSGAIEPGVLPIDISEFSSGATNVVLSGFPAGSLLSEGVTPDNGATWVFAGPLPEDVAFTPPSGFTGAFEIAVTIDSSEGVATLTRSAVVEEAVEAPNSAPVIGPISDIMSVEDGVIAAPAAQVQLLLATLVSDADGDPVSVEFTLTYPAGSGLAPEVIAVNPLEDVSFTPPADFFGPVSVTVRADDGQGADNSVTEQSFTLNILPVNDAPSFSFTGGDDVELDASEAVIAGFVQASAGPVNEAGQSISYEVTTNNDDLFAVLPTISADGELSYALVDGAFGEATVTVIARDNGGVLEGGVDASAAQSFTINVPESVDDDEAVVVLDEPGVLTLDGSREAVVEIPHEEAFEFDRGAVAFSFVADDLNGTQGLFAKDAFFFSGGGNHTVAYLSGNNLLVRLQDGQGSEVLSFSGIEAGREYEVAFTFGPDGGALWVDGERVDTADIAVDWNLNQEFIQWGALGWSSQTGEAGFEAPFSGVIADRQIYNGALTDEAIVELAANSALDFPNQDPIAEDDAASTVEGRAVDILVLDNDTDPDGDALTIAEIGEASNGVATLNDDGVSITYVANDGFVGEDSFTYVIDDGEGGLAEATVRVTVREEGVLAPIFFAPGVASFDGTNGSVIEIPHNSSFEVEEGTVAFSFVADDLNGDQGLFVKDATFFSGGGNHVAVWLQGSTLRVRLQDGAGSQFMAFEGIEVGEEYEFALTFGPDGAALWIDGEIVDTADIDFDLRQNQEVIQWGGRGWASQTGQTGFDAPFNGEISDRAIFGEILDGDQIAELASASSIRGEDTNSAPVIGPISDIISVEDGVIAAPAAQVQLLLATLVSDADGDPVSVEFTLTYPAGSGLAPEVIAVNPLEDVSFTPPADFFGPVAVTVRADDGQGADNSVTEQSFTLNILPVNDAPSFSFTGGDGIELVAPEAVIAGFVQASAGPANEAGQSISYEVTTSNDDLFAVLPTISADGELSYALVDGAFGEATVTVVARDSGGVLEGGVDASAAQSFTINVPSANTAPDAVDDEVTTLSGISIDIDVLANDRDADGDGIEVVETTQAQNGSVFFNPELGLIYFPEFGFVGEDSFDYTIIDENGATDTATVRISVLDQRGLPQAVFEADDVLRFDGSAGDVVNLEHQDAFAVDEGTLAFSFEADDVNALQGLVVKDAFSFAGGGNHFATYIQNGQLFFRFQDTSRSERFSVAIEEGVQYEVAASFSADGVKAYVNGELIGESDLVLSLADNEQFLQIGGLGWGSGDGNGFFTNPFAGEIGDVALFDQVLDEEQIDILALDTSLLI